MENFEAEKLDEITQYTKAHEQGISLSQNSATNRIHEETRTGELYKLDLE